MNPRGRRLVPAACALLAGLVVCQAGPARAANFSINPTQVYLSAKVTSALVSLRNESNEPVRFQLTINAWDQGPNGEMKLTPSDDVIFFPRLMTLAPREDRRIRLGLSKPASAVEVSYRLVVEELPASTADNTPGAVKILTKMSVPIFVQPPASAPKPLLESLAVKSGHATFVVRNSGNAHFVPDAIAVQGLDPDGQAVVSQSVSGWYILAGGVRQFDVELPKADCARAVSVVVTMRASGTTLTQKVETPGGACAQ